MGCEEDLKGRESHRNTSLLDTSGVIVHRTYHPFSTFSPNPKATLSRSSSYSGRRKTKMFFWRVKQASQACISCHKRKLRCDASFRGCRCSRCLRTGNQHCILRERNPRL
ncbi:hypothetical protein BJX63DRAFT_412985 [Aspergillus granulosus]|uniref:Zn(2)-C6 fungal-type domain-containing protein n=1 Tax=Aspergillus granulosus TaxID=176169 RepID=A0ABR4GVN8_9EURO